jgi:hypothetical protein
MKYTLSFCGALDTVLHACRQAGPTNLLGELEKLEILDSSMLISSSAASPMSSRDAVRDRLLPVTKAAAPPCWRVREWSVGSSGAPRTFPGLLGNHQPRQVQAMG